MKNQGISSTLVKWSINKDVGDRAEALCALSVVDSTTYMSVKGRIKPDKVLPLSVLHESFGMYCEFMFTFNPSFVCVEKINPKIYKSTLTDQDDYIFSPVNEFDSSGLEPISVEILKLSGLGTFIQIMVKTNNTIKGVDGVVKGVFPEKRTLKDPAKTLRCFTFNQAVCLYVQLELICDSDSDQIKLQRLRYIIADWFGVEQIAIDNCISQYPNVTVPLTLDQIKALNGE